MKSKIIYSKTAFSLNYRTTDGRVMKVCDMTLQEAKSMTERFLTLRHIRHIWIKHPLTGRFC